MIAALVPVKELGAAKSRLHGAAPAAALARAMLEDVLEALAAVPGLDAVAVVSGDPEVARVAEAAGARALRHPDSGLNPSLDAAGGALAADGADALLVVLGDVPGAEPGDLQALLDAGAALGAPGVVLAPSSDGGSSALLRTPPDAIPNAFGPDSAARHRALAREAGVPFRALPLPSLALDLDSAEDLRAFRERAPGASGRRTRALLEAASRAGEPA